MRDPKRIEEALHCIQLLWQQEPDMRFNQLMYALQMEYSELNNTAKQEAYVKHDERTNFLMFEKRFFYDLFYVEDDDFIAFLKQKLKEEF